VQRREEGPGGGRGLSRGKNQIERQTISSGDEGNGGGKSRGAGEESESD
jgi:hypothetical protein